MVLPSSTLGYASGLAEPFGNVLALRRLPRACAQARIPIGVAHALLHEAVARAGELRLGLDAGCAATLGDAGAIDYAMHSAASVRAALEVLSRFIRVVNGELAIALDVDGDSAWLEMSSCAAMPAAAEDFLMSALYTVHLRALVPEGGVLECRLVQASSASDAELARAFGASRVVLGCSRRGFLLDSRSLDAPLPRADAKLHAILIKQLQRELDELPEVLSFRERVHKLVAQERPLHASTLKLVAQALHMTSRTLSRRLQREGTSFAEIVDDVRRMHASAALHQGQLSIEQLAHELGFSCSTAFHRAFKRWTGLTPRQYVRRPR